MTEPAIVFYDGACGMCHGSVRFLIARDAAATMRFAPLDGPTLVERLTEDQRATLPDSLVFFDPASRGLWLRSEAVRQSLLRLGGGWAWVGRAMGWVPRALRDVVYDAVARVRHRVMKPPPDACPVVAPGLRARFLP